MPQLPITGERMTKGGIVHYIRTMLGGTQHATELDDQQIDLAIDKSIRLFRRYLFGRRTIAKPQVVGIGRYALPAGTFAITRFDVLTTDRPSFAEAELNVFELNRNRLYGLYGDRPGALHELMTHIEQSRRTRGTEPEYWHFRFAADGDPVNDIVIYVPSGPRDVSYDVALPINEVEDVPFIHEQLFLDTVEANSRSILGDMRGKYGGNLPGPTGDLTLDADFQRTKATEMMTEIKTELRLLGKAMPPVTG